MNARRPVPSPCVSVCRMEPDTGLCTGCLRTIDEIAGWGSSSDTDKLAVWAAIERRRLARASAATGGASAAAPAPTHDASGDAAPSPAASPWKPAR